MGWSHNYEELQNFNFIVRYLHSVRYRNLEKLLLKLSDKNRNIVRIVDVGCGNAKVFKTALDLGIQFEYLGIEPNQGFCEMASDRYSSFDNFEIICDSIGNQFDKFNGADLIVGLESFEHIPECLVVRTIEAISKVKFKYLYITVPNEVGLAILIKNVGSFLMGYHRRYKTYTWRETFAASIYELDSVRRHTINHIGFDWRWLAHSLRQNVRIIHKTTSPLNIIPKFVSPSIGFVCVHDEYLEK